MGADTGPEYDKSYLAGKDRLRPWRGGTSKWPPNGVSRTENRQTFLASYAAIPAQLAGHFPRGKSKSGRERSRTNE
jgi:hypothetical protein